MPRTKIVEFDTWCPTCLHFSLPEEEEPCRDCLNEAARVDSRKPVEWRSKDVERRKD